MIRLVVGLMIFSFGLYMMIAADLGFQPWDCFAMGVAGKLGITYGQSSMWIGLTVLVIDLFLREKIGIGTILNAVTVGYFVDFYSWLHIIPDNLNIVVALIVLVAGMFVMGIGYYVDMKPGLGFGPRDALMVGIGKRLRKLSVGLVNNIVLAVVLVFGFILGGKVGVGTVISVLGLGFAMQVVFNIFKFEPRDVINDDVKQFFKTLIKNDLSPHQKAETVNSEG